MLTPIAAHGEPDDYRGPFDPVRAAIRRTARNAFCHRCDEQSVPDLVHLADAAGAPLCSECTRLLRPALRRGLQALNQLAHAVREPHAHPAPALVRDWRMALAAARPEEERLLLEAAALLAAYVGGRGAAP